MAVLDKRNELDDFDLDFDDEVENLESQELFEDDLVENISNESGSEIDDFLNDDTFNESSEDIEEGTAKLETESDSIEDNMSVSENGTTDSERSDKLKNYILYIISDKTFPGMLSYFRHYGSKVTKIFSNLNDAKDVLLMQIEPCKIVVIDSGTGKFTSMSARKSLMDLLSISDDENRIAIFYTDSVIKSEAKNTEGVEDKDITWHPYKNTAGVLALLLQNLKKEHYIYDMKDEETVDKSDELINFKGATAKIKESMDIGLPILSLNEIIMHESDNISEEESLIRYKVKI